MTTIASELEAVLEQRLKEAGARVRHSPEEDVEVELGGRPLLRGLAYYGTDTVARAAIAVAWKTLEAEHHRLSAQAIKAATTNEPLAAEAWAVVLGLVPVKGRRPTLAQLVDEADLPAPRVRAVIRESLTAWVLR